MATITYDVINPDGSRRTVTETVPPETVNQQTLQDQATAALVTNRTYAALASPTNAQVVAATQAQARQLNGIIRLLLNQLDATN